VGGDFLGSDAEVLNRGFLVLVKIAASLAGEVRDRDWPPDAWMSTKWKQYSSQLLWWER
jgi:hypothetical protein